MFKEWNTGDLTKSDSYDGNTDYNHVEAIDQNDRVNKASINRPLRNLYENTETNNRFLKDYAKNTSMTKGVLKDGLTQEFSFGDTDVFSITVRSAGGDTKMFYSRLSPGIANINGEIVVSNPNILDVERKLEYILDLKNYNDESVEIKYYESTDRFQIRVKQSDINGIIINHDYGGTWGDSTAGYYTGLAALNAVYGDSYFRDSMETAVGIDLTSLGLEPTIAISDGDTVFWYANASGNIVGDTSGGNTVNDLLLYRSTVDLTGDSTISQNIDDRTYLQNFNDFSQYLYLNVPQTWGDTDTNSITNPYEDTTADYSEITNQNTLLVFLRKSTGDTYDSSIFGWYEENVPDIDQTRSDKFFMNKDLIVRTDLSGDTLGSSWVSMKELSGDSWTFYGDKQFLNGYFHQTGTNTEFSLTDSSTDSFKIDSAGGVDIDVNNGFRIDENSSSYFDMTTTGNILLTSNASTTVTANGGNLTLTAIQDIILSASGDSIVMNSAKVVARPTSTVADSFKIDSAGGVDIDVDNGFRIDENSGSYFNMDTTGNITIAANNGQTLSLQDLGGTNVFSLNDNTGVWDLNGTEFQIDTTTLDVNSTTNTFNGTNLTATMSNAFTTSSDTLSMSTSSSSIVAGDSVVITSGTGDIIFRSGKDFYFEAVGDTINWTSDTFAFNIDSYVLNTSNYTIVTGSGQLTLESNEGDSDSIYMRTPSGGILIEASQNIHARATQEVILTGDSIYMAASGGSFITDTNGKLTLQSNTNQPIVIDARGSTSGDVQINSGGTADILLDASTNEIDLTATTIDINGTTVDIDASGGQASFISTYANASAVKIQATSGGVDIDASDDIFITAGDVIDIDGDEFYVDASNASISIDTNGDLTVSAANGRTLFLAATQEIDLNSSILDINATTIDIDSTYFALNTVQTIDIISTLAMEITSGSTMRLDAQSALIYNSNASDLSLRINNSEKIRVDSSGNIRLTPSTSTTILGTTTSITSTTFSSDSTSINFTPETFALTVDNAGASSISLTSSNGGIVINADDTLNIDANDLDIDLVGTLSIDAGANSSRIEIENSPSNINITAVGISSDVDILAGNDITIIPTGDLLLNPGGTYTISGAIGNISATTSVDIWAPTGSYVKLRDENGFGYVNVDGTNSHVVIDNTASTIGNIYLNAKSTIDLNAVTLDVDTSGNIDMRTSAGYVYIAETVNSNRLHINNLISNLITVSGSASLITNAGSTYVSVLSSGSVDITSAGAISLESNGGGDITLTASLAGGDILLDASGNEIDLLTATLDINAATTDISGTLTTTGALTASSTLEVVGAADFNDSDVQVNTTAGAVTGYVRNITISTGAPSGGVSGDIWIQY